MKLILFAAVVMFKCSRLSSAPAESTSEVGVTSGSENELALAQPTYEGGRQPSLTYASDSDDLGTTGVVFQFRRSIKSDNTEIEARRRSALDKGFMRFGRGGGNMLRFGRSPVEDYDGDEQLEPKMRRADSNRLRFGRSGGGFDYNDAREEDEDVFLEKPTLRSLNNRYDEHGSKIIRLGRSSSESASTENEIPAESQRAAESNKKADRNMLRFGRANVLRFGKRANVLRFGRDPSRKFYAVPSAYYQNRAIRANAGDRNLLRLGRAGNLIRFGRNEKNVMRFGKRDGARAIASSTKYICEDDDCIFQENHNQLLENPQIAKNDQLRELFGNDEASKQGYGEYVNERK